MKTCPSCQLQYPNDSTFCFVDGQTLESASDALIGSTVDGRYRIDAPRGETAWAKTYRARHRLVLQPVTVKLFNPIVLDQQRERFQDDFNKAVLCARRCTHPNILELEAGALRDDGGAYVVHRAAAGAPFLKELVKRPITPERAVNIASQLLRALGRIHDFGAVHGSLRPSNILLSSDDHVWVMEVGLGRALVRNPWDDDPASFAAQCYLAPELSSSERSSAAADIFAVGVISFQAMTGRLPFEADDVKELRTMLSSENALGVSDTLPGMHAAVASWLESMIHRFPDKRPANAHQALEALREAAETAGMTVPADSTAAAEKMSADLDPSFDRWQRYRGLFAKMMELGFPGGAPGTSRDVYETLCGKVDVLNEVGRKAIFELGNIREVATRAREGRNRIADQMSELTAQAKVVHKELEPLRVAHARHGEKASHFPQQVLQAHKEVVRWEGRSGFAEPYKELADAYRQISELVEKWWSVRSAQLVCQQDAAEKTEVLKGLEGQLEELREALVVQESNLAAEFEGVEQSLSALGNQADSLEPELFGLAARFSAPLRSKPELGACFQELKTV